MAEKTKAPKALYSEKGQQLLSWMQMNHANEPVSNKVLAEELDTKPIAISSIARSLERKGVVETVDIEGGGKGVQLNDAGRIAAPYATEAPVEPAETETESETVTA